jgi:hypothetical protein
MPFAKRDASTDGKIQTIIDGYNSASAELERVLATIPPDCEYCSYIIDYPVVHNGPCQWTPDGWKLENAENG